MTAVAEYPKRDRRHALALKGAPAGITLGSRRIDPLSQAAMLESSGGPGLVRAFTWAIVALVCLLIGWAAMARIDEVAIAFGQVLPSGWVQQVQHLEGGIVAEILVDDGDRVRTGQPLIRLQAAGTAPEYTQTKTRLAALGLEAERLRAFATDRAPDFPPVDPSLAWLLADQKALFEVQQRNRENQFAVLEQQLAQQQSQLEAFEAQERAVAVQLPLIQEEATMRRELFGKGLTSKVALLNAERQLAEVQGELARLLPQKAEVRSAIAETRKRHIELDDRLRREALDQLAVISREYAQVNEAIEKLRDRTERLELRAPADGIVKGLTVRTIGGVLKPGETILEVVPVDDEMVLEVRISTQDIGYVQTGLPVTVKLTAYDFARFGAVDGTLARISATTFQDEEGRPYYRGLVTLDKGHVGDDPEAHRIIPGMAALAEIKTGDRTILNYLLKPIRRALDQGLRER